MGGGNGAAWELPATGAGGALTTGAVGGRGDAAFFAGGRAGSRAPFCFTAPGSAASGSGLKPSAGSTIGAGGGGGGSPRSIASSRLVS